MISQMDLEALDPEEEEDYFVLPVPEASEEDDEETELVFNIVPLEEGLALLDAEEQ
jgi:hypothetical protein